MRLNLLSVKIQSFFSLIQFLERMKMIHKIKCRENIYFIPFGFCQKFSFANNERDEYI